MGELELPRRQSWDLLLVDEIHPSRGDALVLSGPHESIATNGAPGLATRNKKLLVTSASLLVTSALLVVTSSY